MSNTCMCPNPPGGQVTCSDDQLAICGVRDGKIISGCYDRPEHTRSIDNDSERNYALSNWVLEQVTGTRRGDYDLIDAAEFEMLMAGWYVNKRTGEIVKFVVPRDLDLASAARFAPLLEIH